jgi:hypothetical protein
LINGLFGWIWKSSCEPFQLSSGAWVPPDLKTNRVARHANQNTLLAFGSGNLAIDFKQDLLK